MLGLPSSYHQATNDRRSLYAEASGNATREKGLTHTPELPSTTGRDPDGAWASLFPRLHCCELEIRRFPSRRQSRLGSCRRPLGTAGAHSPGSASTKKVRHPRVESRQEPRIARALIENTAGTTHVTASAARSFARLNFGHWTKFCSPLFSLSHVGTPPPLEPVVQNPSPHQRPPAELNLLPTLRHQPSPRNLRLLPHPARNRKFAFAISTTPSPLSATPADQFTI